MDGPTQLRAAAGRAWGADLRRAAVAVLVALALAVLVAGLVVMERGPAPSFGNVAAAGPGPGVALGLPPGCSPGAASPPLPAPGCGAGAEPSAGFGGLAVAAGGYTLVPATTRLTPGQPASWRFRIVEETGRPVRRFERVSDRLLHLIVVRRDLVGYQLLHPVLDATGTWSAWLRLPAPGVYRAFASFTTERGAQTLGVDLFAPGSFRPARLPRPGPVAATGGYTVRMTAARDQLRFQVERYGRPVGDLEPYLGARGHLVALRQGDLAYVHAHPADTATSGASAGFAASFPSAGRYRLFLLFQHQGRVHTAAFTVDRR